MTKQQVNSLNTNEPQKNINLWHTLTSHLEMALTVAIVIASILLCQHIITISAQNQTNKIENAELNHVRYGLLSINTWKEQINEILLDEIDKLDISKENVKDLKPAIEAQLLVLIDKIDARIRQSNKGSVKGRMKQAFLDIFVSMDQIKKGVPEYADAMIKEIKKPRNTGRVKNILRSKTEYYISQTFDTQDMSQINRIVEKTSSLNVNEAKIRLNNEIQINQNIIARDSAILIIFSIIVFLIPAFSRNPISSFQYISLILILITLLVTGVTTPMIDLEAKISQMTFMLLEHPINFENQVLFFQTKSILDVFWVMITNKAVEMRFVGVLVIIFSIVFPAIKLTSTIAYYYDYKNARDNRWINFFVLKSGKWSMADVLVVAIFMAYIGFNGIITSQFGKLKTASKEIVVLTTNGTALQPGFYVFFTFVILAMFLTMYLTKKLPIKGEMQQIH